MKKIFWRVFVYFGVVLFVFATMIGFVFTILNQRNITRTYKQQLSNLATAVANRVSLAATNGEEDTFIDYIRALEDFTTEQEIDVWIVSNVKEKNALGESYTNIDITSVHDISPETQKIINAAYNGEKQNYTDYDAVYQKRMMHVSIPVRNHDGDVIGAVVTSGPMGIQETTIIQYEKYMTLTILVGFILAILLSIFFSRQLVRPIIKIKESANILSRGDYGHKTNVKRKDELGSLAESMDELSDRLVEAKEYQDAIEQNRRDFFSNVSHELKTPITVVKGYADTLESGYVKDLEKQKDYIARIKRECDSMDKLVSDLLVLSRMQNPDYKLEIETINIIAVCQDAMRSMRILFKEKEMQGQVTFDDECSLIEGDYDRIRQLFVILLQNAYKYGNEKTQIRIHIARENGKVIASVHDFGSVIPKDEWNEVFEKFYRAGNKGEKEGSGLGLVVAKHIVDRHGGQISVESYEDKGTEFKLVFTESLLKN